MRAILMLLVLITLSVSGNAQTTVKASANPWLAGMPDGTTTSVGGDSAPAHSPIIAPSAFVVPGAKLEFAVTGSVSSDNGFSAYSGPDGRVSTTTHFNGSENGIADVTAPIEALVGVFLDNNVPTNSVPPPPFADARTNAVFRPALKQPFFIGDGLTGSGAGTRQGFVVPDGATRLFLGTMDSFQWNNNLGSFLVNVTNTPTTNVVLVIEKSPSLQGVWLKDREIDLGPATNTSGFYRLKIQTVVK
jgi:hypothetical protein